MAYSVQTAVSDGTLDLLTITIPYFKRSEISVYFDEVLVLEGVVWNWVGTSAHKISFPVDVPSGVVVRVSRDTDLQKPLHVYTEGAPFVARTLDENFGQTLRAVQEVKDGVKLTDIYSDVDMHGHSFINVGTTLVAADQPYALHKHTASNSSVVPPGYNAISAGPVTIAPGASVVVNTGSTWSIL